MDPFESNLVDKSSVEPLILLKPDSPYFTIVDYNDAFSEVSHTTGIDITGKSMPEIHKWNSENEESALLIHDLLNEVISKKVVITLPAVRYDLPQEDDKQPEASWWQAVYKPILDAKGKLEFILCSTVNITWQIQNPAEKNQTDTTKP